MHKMIVLAKATDGNTDALAQWYDETHIKELLTVPGVVRAERHAVMPLKGPDGLPQWDFILAYELDGDPMVAIGNMAKAQIGTSDFIESSQTLSIVAMSQGVQGED